MLVDSPRRRLISQAFPPEVILRLTKRLPLVRRELQTLAQTQSKGFEGDYMFHSRIRKSRFLSFRQEVHQRFPSFKILQQPVARVVYFINQEKEKRVQLVSTSPVCCPSEKVSSCRSGSARILFSSSIGNNIISQLVPRQELRTLDWCWLIKPFGAHVY